MQLQNKNKKENKEEEIWVPFVPEMVPNGNKGTIFLDMFSALGKPATKVDSRAKLVSKKISR